jgi:hypothetical protein
VADVPSGLSLTPPKKTKVDSGDMAFIRFAQKELGI